MQSFMGYVTQYTGIIHISRGPRKGFLPLTDIRAPPSTNDDYPLSYHVSCGNVPSLITCVTWFGMVPCLSVTLHGLSALFSRAYSCWLLPLCMFFLVSASLTAVVYRSVSSHLLFTLLPFGSDAFHSRSLIAFDLSPFPSIFPLLCLL